MSFSILLVLCTCACFVHGGPTSFSYEGMYPTIASLEDGTAILLWGDEHSILGEIIRSPHEEGLRIEPLHLDYLLFQQGSWTSPAMSGSEFAMCWVESKSGLFSILCQRRTATALIGSALTVRNTTEPIENVASTGLASGGFVVVWEEGERDHIQSVNGRLVSAVGELLGEMFSTTKEYFDVDGEGAGVVDLKSSDGAFLVTWWGRNHQPPTCSTEIFGKVFNATMGGKNERINQEFNGTQQFHYAIGMDQSTVVTVWEEFYGDEVNVVLGVMNVTGTNFFFPRGDVRVSRAPYFFTYPKVTWVKEHYALVIWHTQKQNRNTIGIMGRLMDLSGNNHGPEFTIQNTANLLCACTSIATLNDGTVLVSWSMNDINSNAIVVGVMMEPQLNASNIFYNSSYVEGTHRFLPDIVLHSPIYGNFTVTITVNGGHNSAIQFSSIPSTRSVQVQGSFEEINDILSGFAFQPGPGYRGAVYLSIEISVNTQEHLSGSIILQEVSSITPHMVVNWLNIYKGQTVPLSGTNIMATSTAPQHSLFFMVSGVLNGHFSVEGIKDALTFTKRQLDQGSVHFTHTPSDALVPSYSISVSDGEFQGAALEATVHFIDGNEVTPPLHLGLTISLTVTCLILLVGCIFVFVFVFIRNSRLGVASRQTGVEMVTMEQSTAPLATTKKTVDKLRTVIGGKYELYNKIEKEEAVILKEQTGFRVVYPPNVNKVKVSVGKGQHGKIKIAREIDSQKFVAVKIIEGEAKIKLSANESRMQVLLHGEKHIIPLLDTVRTGLDKNLVYHFMDLAGFGSGETLIEAFNLLEQKSTFPDNPQMKEGILVEVARGLLIGLSNMHQRDIFHLDMKPKNFVIDREGNPYIIDFGCAMQLPRRTTKIDVGIQACGDIRYFSPQRLASYRGECLSFDAAYSDAWSLGLALLECAIGRYPLETMSRHDRLKLTADAVQYQLDCLREFQSAEPGSFYAALRELLNTNPDAFCGVDGVLKMAIFEKGVFESEEYHMVFGQITELLAQWENDYYNPSAPRHKLRREANSADRYSSQEEDDTFSYKYTGYGMTPNMDPSGVYCRTPTAPSKPIGQ